MYVHGFAVWLTITLTTTESLESDKQYVGSWHCQLVDNQFDIKIIEVT